MMIDLHSLLRKERAQKHFELMNARIKLAALGRGRRSRMTKPRFPRRSLTNNWRRTPRFSKPRPRSSDGQETVDLMAKHTADPENRAGSRERNRTWKRAEEKTGPVTNEDPARPLPSN